MPLKRTTRPAPAPPALPVSPSPSLVDTITHGVGSGIGTGIGFSLAQSFMRQFMTEKPKIENAKTCDQYDINLQKCMFENDMETCHKIFKNMDTNFYSKCVPVTNQLPKE